MRIARALKPHTRERYLLLIAAAFHLALSCTTYVIGTRGLLPHAIDTNTLGSFAPDTQLYIKQATFLVERLSAGKFGVLFEPLDLHIKIYAFAYWLLSPLFGFTCMSIEPLNLFYYVVTVTLVYKLGTLVFDPAAGLCASIVVALWPSYLAHTTQPLRDPLTLMLMLALVLTFASFLIARPSLRMICLGALSVVLLRMARPNAWLLVIAALVIGSGLYLLRSIKDKRVSRRNLAAIALVLILAFLSSFVFRGPTIEECSGPLARVCAIREEVIGNSLGLQSNIDADVRLLSTWAVIKYVPRALEIGLFAPFPYMWFEQGHHVGGLGRLISGFETFFLYLMYLGAAYGIWSKRTSLAVWFLAFTVTFGVLAIGLVVVNIGTLYRLRYPFGMIVIVLGCGGFVTLMRLKSRDGHA